MGRSVLLTVREEWGGRAGASLGDKWADGVQSLHGILTRGFPNLMIMPAPYQQVLSTRP